MFLELIELSILAFRSAWLSMLALILMRMNIKVDILTRSVLGMLRMLRSKILRRVEHKQRNQLNRQPALLTQRTPKIRFLQLSSQEHRQGNLMTFHSDLDDKVKLIQKAFNAVIV